MRNKRRHAGLSIGCALAVMVIGGAAHAASWYDYYVEAQRAAQKKDWQKAITLFEQAIASDPNSQKKKKFGMRSVDYFPYFDLGMAYMALGDYAAAHENCQAEADRGAAPQQPVAECIDMAARALQTMGGAARAQLFRSSRSKPMPTRSC